MALSGKKTSTPLKNMDIKAAFQLSTARKRKASLSKSCEIDTKNVKVCGYQSDKEVEIIEDAPEVKPRVQLETVESTECKENTNLNVANDDISSHVNSSNSSNGSSKNLQNVKKLEISKKSDSSDDAAIYEDNTSTDNIDSSEVFSSNNVSINEEMLNGEGKTENEIKAESVCKYEILSGSYAVEVKEKSSSDVKAKKRRRMTPEEARKKAEEREKKQQQKREELEARRRERQQEKEKKLKERQMRKELEEQEKKERERLKQEKREQEEKEKLQRLKEKEEKNKMKLEEKKRKEEMKQKREEELKKAEEEKRKARLEKEQKEKEKKERAKAAFARYFLKGDCHSSPSASQALGKEGVFRPFEVSGHMILAPVVPQAAQERFDKERLDHFLQYQDGKELYLQILKSGSYQDVRHRKREKKLKTCEADVILDKSEEANLTMTAKLLQFCENVRPPYWGTWRKKSKNVRPRNPFGEDNTLDYTVDSDEEWDEGGPGESLSGTEQEDESEDDYEVDNDFFVPHGYLSAEEEKEEDEEVVNDPEKQKALLKIKLQEFEMQRKKKTTELKPIILGCFIENKSHCQDSSIYKFLEPYAAVIISDTPIPTTFSIKQTEAELRQQSNALERSSPTSSSVSSKRKALDVPEEAMPHLIRLVHGNINKRSTLIKEFQDYWLQYCNQNTAAQIVEGNLNASESALPCPSTDCELQNQDKISETQTANSNQISKLQLSKMIRNIATYGKCPSSAMKKYCWWVQEDIREKYGLFNLPIPNQWNYTSCEKAGELSPSGKQSSTSIKEFLIS